MRVPAPLYRIQTDLAHHLPLRPAQIRGLALWIYGAVLAHSACQSAVLAALSPSGPDHALRQRLREWLYDGQHKAAPCRTQVEVARCFAPLLRWVLAWWRGHEMALAIDATTCRASVTVLVVSVLYRGCAIPVAWAVRPGNQAGPWLGSILGLLDQPHPAVPERFTVLVLADRGLWSPRLWAHIRALGWHPLLRVQNHTGVRREAQPACTARDLARPDQAWIGRVRLGARHLGGTLIVVWHAGREEPCAVVTDLAPERVGAAWYGLRMWAELGFRALKGFGWQWQRSRRSDPERVARHWLVLALCSLWTLAHGTRCEDAQRVGVAPSWLRAPVSLDASGCRRQTSVLRRGLQQLNSLLARGGPWRCLWLQPEPWPQPPPDLAVIIHGEG
jgi:hypothetical protein